MEKKPYIHTRLEPAELREFCVSMVCLLYCTQGLPPPHRRRRILRRWWWRETSAASLESPPHHARGAAKYPAFFSAGRGGGLRGGLPGCSLRRPYIHTCSRAASGREGGRKDYAFFIFLAGSVFSGAPPTPCTGGDSYCRARECRLPPMVLYCKHKEFISITIRYIKERVYGLLPTITPTTRVRQRQQKGGFT